MRWVVLLAAVLAGFSEDAAARKKLVISDPPMVRKCPRAKTWNAVMACLAPHYDARVTREVRGAKLVTLVQKAGKGQPPIDSGVLLYVERNGNWQIGGRFETYGGEYAVLGLEPITVGKRTGYRLDLGQVSQTTLMVDNVSPIQAVIRTRRSMFCSGDSYACPDATTACEVTVDGSAWMVFRGKVTMQDNVALIEGDRTHAGNYCQATEKVYLGWAQR